MTTINRLSKLPEDSRIKQFFVNTDENYIFVPWFSEMQDIKQSLKVSSINGIKYHSYFHLYSIDFHHIYLFLIYQIEYVQCIEVWEWHDSLMS